MLVDVRFGFPATRLRPAVFVQLPPPGEHPNTRRYAVSVDAPTREDTERRQTIWWYLLALAGVLFATETLMSNRLSRRTG